MSTSYDVHLIYGFPVPPDYLERINPEAGSRKVYLDEWLESERLRPAEQFNAGQSNGGYPEYLVGIALDSVRDCTRGRAYKRVDTKVIIPPKSEQVVEAARRLGVSWERVGIYILGDAA